MTDARAAQIVRRSREVNDFATICQAKMVSRGRGLEAIEWAKQNGANPRVLSVLKATAATAASSTDSWANELVSGENLASGFLAACAAWGAYDRMRPDMRQMPLRTVIRAITSSAVASVTGEADVKSLTEMALVNDVLEPKKAIGTVIVSAELARLGGPDATDLIRGNLVRSVTSAVDSIFIDDLANTAGVATTVSSGLTGAAFISDIEELLEGLAVGPDSRIYCLVPTALWKRLILATTSGGYPVMSSNTIGGGTIKVVAYGSWDVAADKAILVDASQVACGGDDNVRIDASGEASVDLAGGSSPMLSLWQKNLLGVLVERWVGAQCLNKDSLGIITGVSGATA